MFEDLGFTSASQLARDIAKREISPVEVMEALIRRVEDINPSLNAIVFEDFDEARTRAREAEAMVQSRDRLGPLHGVPTVMKDLFCFKPGWPGSFGGLRNTQSFRATGYCDYVERVERAGAIFIGRTNSPVFGFRGTCDNPRYGPTKNPFDTTRNSGGSSGGSAAAVAAGLVPFGGGTDGGGSIRIPASWCGVYGLKPSFGRVPFTGRPNAFGATSPFIFEGPITRTVEDAALVLSVLQGDDPRDPFAAPAPIDTLAATQKSIKGLRIAYSPALDVFPVDREVADVVHRAVSALDAAGAVVDEVRLGLTMDQHELSDLWCRLMVPQNMDAIESLHLLGFDVSSEEDGLPPELMRWLAMSDQLSVRDLILDQHRRSHVFDCFSQVFDNYDLLITPTLAVTATPNANDGNTVGPSIVNGIAVDPLIGWCLTYPINFTGYPAASVPAGLTSTSLPVGLQVIGAKNRDDLVLTVSAALEKIQPWVDSYPHRVATAPDVSPPV